MAGAPLRSLGRWLLVVAALLGAACGRGAETTKKRGEAVAVSVASVVERDVPFEVSAFGSVEASSTVSVVAQVNGLVTEVHFQEGAFVKKGDPLFTIDTRPYRASLAVAQAELIRSQALAAQARTEAERALKLEYEGLASEQELLKSRADADSTAASVKVSQAQLQSAGLNVALTKIMSPLDGRTGTLLVHAGNVVHSTDTQPLVVIRSMSPVQVRFAVPEEFVARIRARQAQAPLVVRATPRGEGARTVEGPLTFVENTVDPATGTLSLKATFQNTGLELWPGAAVDVALVLDVDRKAIVVPEGAVQEGQSGTFAFVIDQDDKAVMRPVEVARSTPSWTLIRSGLKPGERVVTDGHVRLQNGSKVSIKAEPAAGKRPERDGGAKSVSP